MTWCGDNALMKGGTIPRKQAQQWCGVGKRVGGGMWWGQGCCTLRPRAAFEIEREDVFFVLKFLN